MGLTLLLGLPGSGKTEWLYRRALEAANCHRDKTVLFVVPEQFSLQTMKDLLVRSDSGAMSNIEVLSLLRLSYRIFSELSVKTGELLSDTGKSLLLKRVLSRLSGELRVFASNTKKPGFLDELKSIISEFYQYGITPELLFSKAEAEENSELRLKLHDIALLYRGFCEQLEGKYQPSETIFDVLARHVGRSEVLRDCYCFLDGFTGFTPSQYGLLTSLFTCARESFLSLTSDASILSMQPAEHSLFYFPYQTSKVLMGLAHDAGCPVETIYLDGTAGPTRFEHQPVLETLVTGLFRYPVKKRVSCNRTIRIAARMNRAEEAAAVVADIERRVRLENLRYGSIAVVTGDIAGYGDLLLTECDRAGIPAFLDSKRKITHNPCISLIRSVIANAIAGFSFDSVFRYLKCGFAGLTDTETAKLENYCIACGIRGESSFKKEWCYRYRTKGEIDLTEINALRERVLMELSDITSGLRHEKTAGGKTRVLYAFLHEHQVEEKLAAMADNFEESGDFVRAQEYGQIYQKVIELLEHFVELLDTEEVSLPEYLSLVEAGLREMKFGLVPNGSDYVVLGDLMRTRLSDIEVLYLVGANEGVTPAPAGGGGLISEADRDSLKKRQLELAPSRKDAAFMEQYYLYQMLTKPSKRLMLSFCRLSAAGEEMKPAYFVRRVQELFTDLVVEDCEESYQEILRNDRGRTYFLQGLWRYVTQGGEEPAFLEMYRERNAEAKEETKTLLSTAFFGNPTGRISAAVAKQLYGEILYGSVTRMEKYAACAFAHFLQYGLSLKERAEYKVSAPELGTLYHDALQRFMDRVRNEGSFHSLTAMQSAQYCEECLLEAVKQFKNGVFEGSERNSFLVQKAKRILVRTVWALRRQMAGSLFTPEQCEADYELLLDEMCLHGKIDRYDWCTNGGIDYVRVVDYKSGSKELDFTEIYYGLQVQLCVYMKAVKQMAEKLHHKEPEIAGLLYSYIRDPFLAREKASEDEMMKAYRPSGLLNLAPSALTAMDTELAAANGGLMPSVVSKLVPIATDAEGRVKSNATVPGEYFTALSDYVFDKLRTEAREIYEGNTEAKPYRYKGRTPCEYCEYSTVCGFDNKLNECHYRVLSAKRADECFDETKGV